MTGGGGGGWVGRGQGGIEEEEEEKKKIDLGTEEILTSAEREKSGRKGGRGSRASEEKEAAPNDG